MTSGSRIGRTQEPKTVLVTGATGKQGGAIARSLLDRGHTVRAMTRDPASDAAKELGRLGAEVVEGDFTKPRTIKTAADDVDAAYAMSTPHEDGPEAEAEQGKQLVTALDEAGVDHVVYSSVAGARDDTGVPIFDSKVPVEACLTEECDAAHTIVAPVFFRENLLAEQMVDQIKKETLTMALPAGTPLQTIAVEEIGDFVRHVIENPDAFDGKRIEIASDELTGPEMAARLAAATGQRMQYNELSLNELKEQNPTYGVMFEWFQEEGYSVDVAGLKQSYADVNWQTFDEWANDQDWQHILGQRVEPAIA